ncbi:ATP-dependent metallopeptidase FtsH/Yme1/Tma family protein [Tissierella creatinophila]|uniref:ATP-dependent zinc metalloprotease FtsH n=1 Tax=Tissierella creatinophila DSM 6911 TaxID=1123403 RepID=A0A1U7M5R2_TISCR|nr:ATP-dependent metallopeptidase FtsH/Yme1/Tma family protein [Tissierella creatinophila]OLS02528.1 ATP-dependent zinc metalloprotease FtsH [Tissierella creatinophila DSM 6911]
MKNKKRYLILGIVLIIITTLIFFVLRKDDKAISMSYTSFMDELQKSNVKEVTIGKSPNIEGVLKDGKKFITDNPRTEDFKKELLVKDVEVNEQDIELGDKIVSIVLSIGLVVLVLYMRKNYSKVAEKEINNLAQIEKIDYDNSIKFKDVAGNEEAKEALHEMVDFINRPEVYEKYGAKLPRGVLLYGPPGTGKTLLAKALAGEAGVPIFPVSGSDFIQVYSGLGASRIRSLFKKAKEAGKSVIFIDEIDSLGKKRKGMDASSNEEGDRTLNALLAEMSGFKDSEGIIVVAATNRIDVLDEALLRPGRFDRQIEIQLPDVVAREKILNLHAKNKPLDEDVDFKRVALETIYFSGAKLENLLNESAIIAAKSKCKLISQNDIDKAYYKVLVGDEKKERNSITLKDREITAYHEAGHALVTKLVCKENRVTRVSIIPSTKGMGGFSLNIPKESIYKTKKEILANTMIALAGRASEEIIFGKDYITTGASSDLEKSTTMIISLIGIYGMDSQAGLLNYNAISNDFSQDMKIINRSKEILDSLYLDTIKLLQDNKVKLNILAKSLLEKETLGEEEINNILKSI